jgi:hypothetical protein
MAAQLECHKWGIIVLVWLLVSCRIIDSVVSPFWVFGRHCSSFTSRRSCLIRERHFESLVAIAIHLLAGDRFSFKSNILSILVDDSSHWQTQIWEHCNYWVYGLNRPLILYTGHWHIQGVLRVTLAHVSEISCHNAPYELMYSQGVTIPVFVVKRKDESLRPLFQSSQHVCHW